MCCKQLPAHFALHETIDLQKNRRQFWFVNILSLVLAAALAVAGAFIAPFSGFLSRLSEEGYLAGELLLACLTAIAATVLYFIAHELTHGVFLYAFTRVKPKFGFVGWAAYCGNTAYCDRPRYCIVALAPLVIWGAVFGVLNAFLRTGIWFWAIWLLQIFNVSGAAGDLFVFCKILRAPKGALVNDTGLKMCVYAPAEAPSEEEASVEKGENV